MSIEDERCEVEVLDGELVEHTGRRVDPADAERLPIWAGAPAVQTAVAAATGFVAGAATLALLRLYAQSRLERAAAPPPGELLRVGHARTYVVHVRNLG